MSWTLVEDDAALAAVLAENAGADAVMVDTEFMRRNTFYPQIALVQLCFDRPGEDEPTAWLVDPLAIEDAGPLADLLADPGIVKVLHSPSEDLEVFQRWLGTLPQPMFDTQRAAALLDRGFGLGYRAVVHDVCGVDLPKGETRSDWLQRPLTDSQCHYAAQDVAYLLPVWRELHGACEAAGRTGWVLADGRDATTQAGQGAADYYKRIKSAWKLDRRQLGALVAVSDWREQTARRRDKPRNWIIDDKACLELARRAPTSLAALKSSVDLPPPVVRRHGEELVALLAAQRDVPEGDLPRSLPGPLSAQQRDELKALKDRARELAGGLGIAPEILLQSKDYELLLREAAGESVREPLHWQGWRASVAIAPLRESLAS